MEAQIREYESNLEQLQTTPEAPSPSRPRSTPPSELNLEAIGGRQIKAEQELENDFVYVNDQGVQKYDLPKLITRIRGFFKAPSTSNPKLVSYLAAGGIQGLRPLRYEKRVARNRFVVFSLVLLVLLIGLIMAFLPR